MKRFQMWCFLLFDIYLIFTDRKFKMDKTKEEVVGSILFKKNV